MIYHFDLGGYGVWSIVLVTASYMRFGSTGIKSACQKYVAEATGTGNFDAASVLITTGSLTMLGLSVLVLTPAAVFSRTLARLSGVPPEFIHATAAAISVLAVAYMIFNFGSVFEAILTGGHRIDLVKKFGVAQAIGESLAMVTALHFGYGFLTIAIIMATSELIYMLGCYVMSKRIVPQVCVSAANFKLSAYPELIRFAGSYQLVSVLELAYLAVVPLTLLKFFGAPAAGVFAVASRLVGSALMVQDASILPLLSGGAMVLGSQSAERVKLFLAKTFKITLAVSLPPLALVAAFGTTLVFAWTGQTSAQFRTAIWLCSLAALFKVISLLQLVLYRASGGAVHDNIRQVLRIGVILVVAGMARTIGFGGVLAGMAGAELLGVIFMFYAMSARFHGFSPRDFFTEAIRTSAATFVVLAAGMAAATLPIPLTLTERWASGIRLVAIGIACLAAAWPAIVLTNMLSSDERRTILNSLVVRRRTIVQANQ